MNNLVAGISTEILHNFILLLALNNDKKVFFYDIQT